MRRLESAVLLDSPLLVADGNPANFVWVIVFVGWIQRERETTSLTIT